MRKLAAFLFSAAVVATATTSAASKEPFRPQFHFTPAKNWMNDPNGMVFYEGEWHLFYQYNPFGNKWGHMSWGHAVSKDLVRWEHLPVAIPEANGIMIFSGSAVVDWKNTTGFGKDGKPPLIAIYTGHRDRRQDQRIAYSNDRGRTWTNFEGNPVLDINMADFRDPKVMWHEDTQKWVMTVALSTEKKIHFYTSGDMKEWKFAGEFGPAGAENGLWECPDLFQVPIEGEPGGARWVLIVNINPGAPAGGSGTQYFVGSFDGSRFVPDPIPSDRAEHVPNGKILADFESGDYVNWKKDGDAFGNTPAGGTLANQQPVSGFRGKGLVNSYQHGDRAEGTLTSQPFEIDAEYIAFLIGGGAFPGQTCMNLLVDDKVMRTATGREEERLSWNNWDVRELRGKRAVLQIVDRRTSGWGHINVDHIMLANEPARSAPEHTLWADFGADFYAAVSWSDVPKSDGRRLWLAWMSNWQYADAVPTSPWRSAMTIPRVLSLRRTPNGLQLVQQPVRELETLRDGKPIEFMGGTFTDAQKWLSSQPDLPELLEIEVQFRGVRGKAPFAVHLHTGADQLTSVSCDPSAPKLMVDRTRSGESGFNRKFAARHFAPLHLADDRLNLRLFLDTSSLEVFAENGTTSVSDLIFPKAGARRVSLTSEGTAPSVDRIVIHRLRPAE